MSQRRCGLSMKEKDALRERVLRLLDQGVPATAIRERLGIGTHIYAQLVQGTKYQGVKGKFLGAYGLP